MKKLLLAAAVATASNGAMAYDMFAAVRLIDNEGADRTYVLDLTELGGITSDNLVGSVALPSELTADINGGIFDDVRWDMFGSVFEETGSTTTAVGVTATNKANAPSPFATGLQLSGAAQELAAFTISEQNFVDGVSVTNEGALTGFFDSAAHGTSEADFNRGIAGVIATGELGETLTLWQYAKASGPKITQGRGPNKVVGTDELPLELNESTGLTATMTSGELTVVPVPAAVWLMGPALAGLGFVRRRAA